jgi:hypothetical protein
MGVMCNASEWSDCSCNVKGKYILGNTGVDGNPIKNAPHYVEDNYVASIYVIQIRNHLWGSCRPGN